jgi:hypothetical protein
MSHIRFYRSRHHPDNGVTYMVSRDGETLFSSGGCEYRRPVWD